MLKQSTHVVGTLLLLMLTISLSGIFYAISMDADVFATSENIETIKLTTQLIPFSSKDYKIPDGTMLNFSSHGEICPTENPCFGELGGWVVALYLENGNLSDIEIGGEVEFNETHYTKVNSYTLNWTSLPLHGRLEVIDVEYDVATNTTLYSLRGSLTMEEFPVSLYFNYPITNGTLILPSGILSFEGQRTIRAQ